MKMCSSCRIPKPESEFYRSRVTRDGLRYDCKECNSPARLVSNAPLRAAFYSRRWRGDFMSEAAELARQIGRDGRRGRSDAGRVLEALGLRKYRVGHGYPPRFRTRINPRLARELADAMNLDPVEIGL